MLVLAAIAGIFASRYWEPGLVCFLLLCGLQWSRIFKPGWTFGLVFLAGLLAAFGLGWGYAAMRQPELPSQPDWLLEARSPTTRHLELERELDSLGGAPRTLWEAADNSRPDDSAGIAREGVYRKGMRFRARVVEVEGRVDRQLRLILENLEPVDNMPSPSESGQPGKEFADRHEAEPRSLDGDFGLVKESIPPELEAWPAWPGRLVFTWHKPATPEGFRPDPPGTAAFLRGDPLSEHEVLPARPLPGQIIELTLKLREIRSLRNHGLWETESYWADRGANIRAWESGPVPRLEILKDGSFSKFYALREGLRQGVLAALPRIEHPEPRTVEAGLAFGKHGADALDSANPEAMIGAESGFLDRNVAAGGDDATDRVGELPGQLGFKAARAADSGDGAYKLNPVPDQSGKIFTPELVPGAELIPALLFGDKYLLDSEDSERFARSTLAHSLALSGLHLGYAAALGYFGVSLLYRARPRLALRLPRQKAAVLGGTVPALVYLWIGSAPPSLLRAALMLAFVGWALFRNRPLVLADALIWAMSAILLLNPLALFDLRLQLSALCIAALAWAHPLFGLINARLKPSSGSAKLKLLRRFLRGFALILLSSLIIQIVLAPILIKSFGLYGLAMPLNAVWLPVLGLVVMPCAFLGLICVVLGLQLLAEFFFAVSVYPCGVLLDLLRWLDGEGGLMSLLPMRPHWITMLGYWLLLSQLPVLFRALSGSGSGAGSEAGSTSGSKGCLGASRLGFARNALQFRRVLAVRFSPKLCLGILLFCLPLLAQMTLNSHDTVELRLLDVGQGQGILVEWKGKRLILDGGGGSNPRFDIGREVLAATLAQNRWPRVDYMLATHLDQDHAQGLVFPLRHISIGWYADNGEAPRTGLSEEIIELLAAQGLERNFLLDGDVLDLGSGLLAEVVHPPQIPGEGSKEANRNSLVVRFVWQGRGLFIACGDIDATAQRSILRRMGRERLQAEVIVLPHHGSGNSLLPEFYQAVQPRLALSSTGYGNTWNFPAPKVKNALLEHGVPLLNTARAGQIRVLWKSGSQPEIDTARWGKLALGGVSDTP